MQRVRIRGKPRQYEEADGSIGRFGQVNERTHWLYANYPCLAVYIQRIDADWAYTMDPNFDPAWDLPESIQPDEDDAGLPTPNLLGYGLAKRLTPIQIQWLQEAGYNGEELGTEHPSKRNARPSRGMQDLREECKTFEEQRKKLTEVIGRDLSPAALVTALLAGDREREAITSFCEEVMSIKEAAERERERRARDRRGMNRCRHPAGIQGQTR